MKNFLKNRFRKDDFLGLALTSLVFLIIFIIFSYIGITDAILDGDIITQIDIRLSEFFNYFKDTRLINFFLFISYFASNFIVFLITILTIIILFLKGKKIEIIGFLSSVIFSSIVVVLSKNIIHRPRPELAVYQENGFSFPSFHSSMSVALYGFILWLFIGNIKKIRKKINIVFLALFIAFLIGFSRLYLNVHYFSDVISGWYVGFLGLFFAITINGYLKYKYKKNKGFFKNYFGKKRKIIIKFLILIGIIIAFINYFYYYNNIVFNNFSKKISYKKIDNLENFFKKNKNYLFTETITGRKTENINFIFLAKNPNKIKNIFYKSGWNQADKLGRYSIKRMGKALLKNEKYEKAPITPLYYNKKIQDFAFQKLTKQENLRFRHHIRIWKLNYKIGDYFIFVGCGVFDDGIKWGITHKIDPDLDKERDYTLGSLETSNLIENVEELNFGKIEGKNFSQDKFFSDGKVYILKLK